MAQNNHPNDPQVEKLLNKLAGVPERDPDAAAGGRARFLAQARELAVPNSQDQRHTGCNKNLYERILETMKPRSVVSTLVLFALLAVAVVFAANNVTTVSAQQILDRAASAQSASQAALGIRHYQIETYENPGALTGDQTGAKTLIDDYEDLATGFSRRVQHYPDGKIYEIIAYDGKYTYWLPPVTDDEQPLEVQRSLADPERVKPAPAGEADPSQPGASNDPNTYHKDLFDQFRSNPRVELKGKITWIDGSQAYVLFAENYQTQKLDNGQEQKTLTGATQMIFDAENYRLLESQTSVRKNGTNIVLNQFRFLVDEVLPDDSPVAWDLSDLQGIVMVDEAQTESREKAEFWAISREELAQHTKFYVLSPIPEGFTEEIVTHNQQVEGEPYRFEIHYTNPAGEDFSLQAVGVMDESFVESSFYDGSYKSASGLLLRYSPGGENGGTSGMLTTPEANSFLLFSSLPREQVEALVETFKLVE